jgi:hypothetical protein
VAFVVEADAREEYGHDGGEELAGRDDAVGDTEVAADIAGDFASRAVGLDRGLTKAGGGEVADDFHVDLGEGDFGWLALAATGARSFLRRADGLPRMVMTTGSDRAA